MNGAFSAASGMQAHSPPRNQMRPSVPNPSRDSITELSMIAIRVCDVRHAASAASAENPLAGPSPAALSR